MKKYFSSYRTILYLDGGGCYTMCTCKKTARTTHIYMYKDTHIQIKACKNGHNLNKSTDCTNISVLAWILYYSYARCHHWGQGTPDFSELFFKPPVSL